eukprot:CAMPEP_0184685658 /NCGR_PEP_ID=MMETSP0312-20130426/19708_1 /TAXON_ID=31354 /ORGANISM="Compsopogon coeruleus, Strain SAG 36.94" /LENGTH=537 /DNA_ID=CAMNT_0027139957 /DNA_START=82 /DNA_END=1695 /DNA_ORIENTATION=+
MGVGNEDGVDGRCEFWMRSSSCSAGSLVSWAGRWAGLSMYHHALEGFFLVLALLLWRQRAYKPRRRGRSRQEGGGGGDAALSKEEVDVVCGSWRPVPLEAPPTVTVQGNSDGADGSEAYVDRLDHNRVEGAVGGGFYLSSMAGPRCRLQGYDADMINLATNDFLGLVGSEKIREACDQTLRQFGCGSCGPRGFYGTTVHHLACEKRIARFLGTDEAILYSFGPATASSVVPAFAKRGDLIVADEAIGFSMQNGIVMSRAAVRWFRHNDTKDLERILLEVEEQDSKTRDWIWERGQMKQRRFILTEAISGKYGDIAPIVEIVGLKHRFGYRLVLDESFSVGVLGATGKGVCDEFDLLRSDIEITVVDAGNALASIGGVCVGDHDVVSRQRLYGAGYCFSASQPPFLAVALTQAAEVLDEEGSERICKLRENIAVFREAILPLRSLPGVSMSSDPKSPLIFISFTEGDMVSRQQRVYTLQRKLVEEHGIYVDVPRYVEQEKSIPDPGIRVALSSAHTRDDLQCAAVKITDVVTSVSREE